MSKSWITDATNQVRALTPTTGFNVVAVDSHEKPGQALYLVGHFTTKEEAEEARVKHEKSSRNISYIYAARG